MSGATRWLVSFDDGAMASIGEAELPAVGEAAHAVVREAKAAGVWVFGGGIMSQRASIVGVDGSVRAGDFPETKAVLGGFCILETRDRNEAESWAAKFAVACRCAQEVREIFYDPES